MHVEPPGPHVHGGQATPGVRRRRRRPPVAAETRADDGFLPQLREAAAAGAFVLVLTGRGDVFLLAGLLGLVAWERRAAATALAAAAALLARWGTSSLPALAGAQSVLGPALVVEPLLDAVAVVSAAAALVLIAPSGPLGLVFGAAAGVVVAGPSWATVPGALVRLVAIAAGAAAVWCLGPRLPERARQAAPALAGLAFLAAVAA
jgi:hypothetical protein